MKIHARCGALAACALALLLSSCGTRDPLEAIRVQQARGDYAGTLEPLRELLTERREDAEVMYLYGLALMAVGEYGAATWPLRQAMESPEWRQQAALHLIRAGLATRDFNVVVELTSKLLEETPDDPLALLYRAQANAYWKKDLEAAVTDARRSLEIEPDQLEAYQPLIVALLGLERYDEAGKELAEAGRRLEETDAPASSLAWHCSTTAIFAADTEEDGKKAEKSWLGCLEKYPADPSVVSNAVEFFDSRGDRARALEVLKKAHAEAPAEWLFRTNLARRLARSGDRAAGEAMLLEATEVEDPRLAHAAWLDLAGFRQSLGDHAGSAEATEKAIERLREVEEPQPADLFSWADALVVADQLDRAIEVADQIEVPSQQALIRGRVAQKRGNPTQALEHFDEALRLWPDNPWAHYYAALAAEDAGSFERALEEYRYAVRIDPSATDARTRAAKLLVAQGMLQPAYQILFLDVAKQPLEAEGRLFGVYLIARAANPAQLQDALLRLARELPEYVPEALARAAEGVEQRVSAAAALQLLKSAPIIDYKSPRATPALRALVRYAHASGQPKIAQQAVDAALAAVPQDPSFQGVLGLHLELGGESEKASAAYRRALEGQPRDADALMGLARLMLAQSPAEATVLLERAASADPSDPEPQVVVAKILRESGREDEAKTRLKAVLDEHPFEVAAAEELAEIDLVRDKVSSETLAWSQRALRFRPSPEALERVGRVHEALGNEREAKQAAESARLLRERQATREPPEGN